MVVFDSTEDAADVAEVDDVVVVVDAGVVVSGVVAAASGEICFASTEVFAVGALVTTAFGIEVPDMVVCANEAVMANALRIKIEMNFFMV